MSSNSFKKFLACLKKSGVVDAGVLRNVLSEFESEDPRKLAKQLIREGTLTRWQAKYLLAGRHRLKIGNYVLLERVRRDELGDRFVALHAQLARKVEIQVLPPVFTDDEELRKKFMSRSSLYAQLDHPNVNHIFDIDQEGGRFYLVIEHVVGESLAEYPVAELTELDAAGIVRQAMAGLTAAHRMEIVHGAVTNENLIITEENQVKLKNLAISSIGKNADPNATDLDDVHSLAKIGLRLLKEVQPGASETQSAALKKTLKRLAECESGQIESLVDNLNVWIAANDSSSARTIITTDEIDADEELKLVPVDEAVVNAKSGQRKDLSAAAKKAVKQASTAPTEADFTPEKKRAFSPLAMAGAGIAALAVLVGLGFLAMNLFGNPDEPKNFALKPDQSTATSTKEDKGKKATSKDSSSETDKGSESKDIANQTRSFLDQMDGKTEASDPEPELPEKESPAETVPAAIANNDAPPAAVDATQQDEPEKTESVAMEPNKETTTEVTVSEPVTTPPKEEKVAAVAQTTAKTEAEPKRKKPDPEKPFRDFPKQFQLPDCGDTTPVQIGYVDMPNNYYMLLELLAPKSISKTKLTFELVRNESDKHRWLVRFKRRKADPWVPVANIWKNEADVNFEWTSEAVNHELANYLRNCSLKFSAKERVSFLALRAPIVIKDFAITEENPVLKIETELAWLPAEEFIRIEISNMEYEGVMRTYAEPREVARKSPGLIFFSESVKNRFLWIQVSADFKKKLRLQAALQVLPGIGAKPVDAKRSVVTTLANNLKMAANSASQQAQVGDEAKPNDMSWTEFNKKVKAIKKTADEAQKIASTAISYSDMLPNLYGKPIPLVVYFELENGVRIELAKSGDPTN